MENVLIVGATSAIGEAVARIYASRGDKLFLLARDKNRISKIAKDLELRGSPDVQWEVFDGVDNGGFSQILDGVFARISRIDIAFIAYGVLPDQTECERSPTAALESLQVNVTSTTLLLCKLSTCMERQKKGTISVVTSVAGDRGRRSNYLYGASKRFVSTFLQGLRVRLLESRVHVLDIKPGFVDTPMTASFSKNALWVTPDKVATKIVLAIDRGADELYVPGFWRWIMGIIKLLPNFIFNRLKSL